MILYGEKKCSFKLDYGKGHVKFGKIYLVKFNISILNRLKRMGFCKYKVMSFLIKL